MNRFIFMMCIIFPVIAISGPVNMSDHSQSHWLNQQSIIELNFDEQLSLENLQLNYNNIKINSIPHPTDKQTEFTAKSNPFLLSQFENNFKPTTAPYFEYSVLAKQPVLATPVPEPFAVFLIVLGLFLVWLSEQKDGKNKK